MENVSKSNIVSQFLAKTYTKTQAYKRLRILKDFLNYKYFQGGAGVTNLKELTDGFYRDYSKENYDPETLTDIGFLSELPESFYSVFSKENINSSLTLIEKEIEIDNNVTIYIPFEMPKDDMEDVGMWFKKNFGENTLFELSFDPSLIGGCALSYKGHYRDFSIKNILSQNGPAINTLLLNLGR